MDQVTSLDYFHDENAAILAVLPLLLRNFLSRESHCHKVLESIDNQITKQLNQDNNKVHGNDLQVNEQNSHSNVELFSYIMKDLKLIRDQLATKIVNRDLLIMKLDKDKHYNIDQNKSIMLDLLFGAMYHEAVEIYQNKLIKMIIFKGEDDTINELPTNYFKARYIMKHPVVIKVDNPKDNINKKLQLQFNTTRNDSRDGIFNIKQLLSTIGLFIDNDLRLRPISTTSFGIEMDLDTCSQENHSKFRKSKTTTHIVDLKTWYCSCDQYQKHYSPLKSDGFERDAMSVMTPTDHLKMTTLKKLTANYATSHDSNILLDLLDSRVNHLSKMPICAHLLAVAMLLFNVDSYPNYELTYTSNVFDLML